LRIKHFEEVKANLRTYLKQYLQMQGRKVENNSVQCPNGSEHKHDDSHLSCGITDDGLAFNCFACDAKGDIFNAAGYLENKPLVGEEFITENFMYLAKLFNIHYELEEVTEDEKQAQKVYLLYDKLKTLLKLQYATDKDTQAYAKARGWEKLADSFEFGACGNYDKLIGQLEKEFDRPIMQRAGIYHKDLFLDRFIIPIRDASGRVCAFGSRSMTEQGRYINSKNNLVYDKSSTLFNLHNARRASSSIYLVEGYADCMTMCKHGIQNVVALGGTAFTAKQYELLIRTRIKKVILAFDNDEAGQAAIDKALIKVIVNKKDMLVYIKEIQDAKDPDEYIVKHGVDKFIALPELTVFEWRLKKFISGQTEELKQQVLQDILNETSYIERDRMCDKFATQTNIRLETIQKEIQRLDVIKNENLNITVTDIVREESEFEIKVNEYEEWAFSRKTELLGLKTGFPKLTEALDGIQSGLYLVGGRPNVGKTAFNLQLAYNLALHNEKVFVLVWSIDDNLKKVIPRLIAMESGMPINVVSNPTHKLTPDKGYTAERVSELLNKREEALNRIKALSRRFLVKDISSGCSIERIEKSVMTCKAITKTENMQLVLFIDNFHKLSTEKHTQDTRTKFTELSEKIKRISNIYDAPVICTVELRKSEHIRPVEDDIKETVDLVYDADCIMLLHNEIHRVGEVESKVYFNDDEGMRRPILECDVIKNKTSGFKGQLFFRFFTELNKVEECDDLESRALKGILCGAPQREVKSGRDFIK
jgi:DNA primase catalytic core